MVMNSSCTKDLGKFMDELIIRIFFLIPLELNIIDRKKNAIHVGWQINLVMINLSQMQIIISFPNEDFIINSNVECHCYCITKTKQF